MYDTILMSGRDAFLVAIPFVFMLFLSVFRLDAAFARPRERASRRWSASGMNEAGGPILCDPDGRLVEPQRPKKKLQKPRHNLAADFHTQVTQFWNE